MKGSLLLLVLRLISTHCFVLPPDTGSSLHKHKEYRSSSSMKNRHRNSNLLILMPSLLSPSPCCSAADPSTFLVRIVFLRAMAFVHAVAFFVALRQNKALMGDQGITPARYVLNEAEERGRIKTQRRLEWRNQGRDRKSSVPKRNPALNLLFHMKRLVGRTVDRNRWLLKLRETLWDRTDGLDRPVTSILWCAKDRQKLNPWLDRIAIVGLLASSLILVLGAANVPLVLTLWLCQRSLMAVGGPWYGYGWEPQLAELSFHALFLVPLWSLDCILPNFPIPGPVRWAIQWYLFRIMMGAGLIKLRSGDRKWKDLTAMDYFYETQPVPNPLTRYFHWTPCWWHKLEVLVNHFVELVAPWLLIVPSFVLPAGWRRAGGLIQILFQAILITSGNLSFLNWLTAVPALVCLDDALASRLFSSSMRLRAQEAAASAAIAASGSRSGRSPLSPVRQVVSLCFLAMIAFLSIPVVKNLLSPRQVMNTSFDPLRLVNSYGAFGTVNTDRDEFIISAAPSFDGPWKEYNFCVKPGDPQKAPKLISPYHHRLDWQMWIAANCRLIDKSPWMYRFLIKLLEQDKGVIALLGDDPWADTAATATNAANGEIMSPKYIRIDQYRYKFHNQQQEQQTKDGDASGEEQGSPPPYWDREFLSRVYPRRGQGLATIESLQEEVLRRTPHRPV